MQPFFGLIVGAVLIALLCWWFGAGAVFGFIWTAMLCAIGAALVAAIIVWLTGPRR